ncbi:MAG: hypothetical protein ACRDPO_35665 [Streptosporangiaceae bacterium]
MNDLDLITRLRPDERLADARELAPARRRLTDAIAAEMSPARAPAAPTSIHPKQKVVSPLAAARTVRPGRRLALAAVALTAAAAGVAAVLLAIPGAREQGVAPPSGASAPAHHPGHSDHSGPPGQASAVKPFTGRLTAARFLDAAARAALTQPVSPPQPGQFVYAETEGPGGSSKYQIWQSADGSQAGLVINTVGTIPLPSCTVAQAQSRHCATTAGYLPGLPVRPSGVLAYLTRIGLADAADQSGGSKLHKPIAHWVANDIGKILAVMLSDTYLEPAQRAALYEFMARTPGFTVEAHATDAIGRSGVGIGWTYQGITNVIIFSHQDYAYLGVRTVTPGQPAYSAALVKFGIVASLPPHATASPIIKPVVSRTPSPGPSPRG